MDPFVILNCGSQAFKSKVDYMGALNPFWNETFNIYVDALSTAIIKI